MMITSDQLEKALLKQLDGTPHFLVSAAVRPGGVVDANLSIAEAPGQAERDIAVGRDAQPLHISGDGIHRRRMLPKSEGAVVVGRVGERERWVGLAGRTA